MIQNQLESMSTDELWEFHQEVSSVLEKRIRNKIHRLENIVEVLELAPSMQPSEAPKRRPYPKVLPKFQNPARPHETWSGRGKQPHWVSQQLEAGKHIEDLRIADVPETAPAASIADVPRTERADIRPSRLRKTSAREKVGAAAQ